MLSHDHAHDLSRGEAERLQRGEILQLDEHSPAGRARDSEHRGAEGDQAE